MVKQLLAAVDVPIVEVDGGRATTFWARWPATGAKQESACCSLPAIATRFSWSATA